MSRMTNDIDNISMTLQQSLGQLITSAVGIVGAIIMMFTISWLLTLICLATLPILFFVTATIARLSQKNFADQQRELSILNGHIEEMYTGHKIVKAFGHEEKAIAQFNEVNERLYQAGWRAQFISGIIFPLMNFINNIGYDQVKPGQTIAIVGPTGAGKTTLVNLLMRFYEIDGGRILVDRVDIRDLKRATLRRLFGMVLQDTWLFNGTIRDNIAYSKEGATDEEIIRAAKAAQADHFIRALPNGYDTILNEDASNISQGEKQLLTIARAFLADPPILILDEATSSVDTRTEIYIQKAMAQLMKGRTCFVIAHRLSTIRDAEMILVMNHGRIIETGTHQQLLAKGGFYADLYNSQFTNMGAHSMVG